MRRSPSPAPALAFDGLDLFLADIGRVPLLGPAEQNELTMRIATGDADARHALIEANVRLVVWCAKPYQRPGLDLLDLVQDGILGLMDATERFDPQRGCRFSTYAVWRIRAALVRTVRAHGQQMRRSAVEHLAGPSEAMATKPDGWFGEASAGRDIEALAAAMAFLPPRERTVLALRFGLDDGARQTLQAVGAHLGVTHQRVRQIQVKALRRLRTMLEDGAG